MRRQLIQRDIENSNGADKATERDIRRDSLVSLSSNYLSRHNDSIDQLNVQTPVDVIKKEKL